MLQATVGEFGSREGLEPYRAVEESENCLFSYCLGDEQQQGLKNVRHQRKMRNIVANQKFASGQCFRCRLPLTECSIGLLNVLRNPSRDCQDSPPVWFI